MLPSALAELADEHQRRQGVLSERALELLADALRRSRPWKPKHWRDLVATFGTDFLRLQVAAASLADGYVSTALELQGADTSADGEVVPAAWAGYSGDGGSILATLVYAPISVYDRNRALGLSKDQARRIVERLAQTIVLTSMQDVGRSAVSTSMHTHAAAIHYVRMLSLPSCARCIVLAGRVYSRRTAFRRHPRCDCRHIPAAENSPSWATDPKRAFQRMSVVEQDRIFTKAGAQAIRDGADIDQVVNARRGATGLTPAGVRLGAGEREALIGDRQRGHLQPTKVYGRDVFITHEGTTVRGRAHEELTKIGGVVQGRGGKYSRAVTPRLMPESIYEIADDRAEVLRLLKRFGYIT